MSSFAHTLPTRFRLSALPRFHLLMVFSSISLLVISFIGCRLTSTTIPDVGSIAIGVVLLIPIILLIPLFWHEKGKMNLRDAALTIPWCIFFKVALPCSIAIAGRLGMNIALQDDNFIRLDHTLGIDIPTVTAYASHHWLGNCINSTYTLLFPLLHAAFLAPALTGQVKKAQQFIVSNLLMFIFCVPMFGFFPAVGPWYGFHLAASPAQLTCQQSLLSLRTPGPYSLLLYGVICFPSFHVIWTIVCANALWCYKLLRIPLVILSTLIILSTMTAGWHYFIDVLAGLVLAAIIVTLTQALCHWHTP
ncbi:MAG: phosphatase PAP2 family protein [Terracidiphilus sp.]